MSPRSSLLRRAAVPLLAVAATALVTSLCAPARAATATLLTQYTNMVSNSPKPGNTVSEGVKCSIYDNSTWNLAVFHAQQLAQNGVSDSYTDNTIRGYGTGDYYDSGSINNASFSRGNYNCWVICSGLDYYSNPWNASTGGTLGTF